MATKSSIPAWRIPWTEEPGGLSPWGRTESSNQHSTSHTSLPVGRLSGSCLGSVPRRADLQAGSHMTRVAEKHVKVVGPTQEPNL